MFNLVHIFNCSLFQLCCVLFKADENELNLRSELRDLKTEQTTVSMSEEFARFFKLQRRIDKLGQDIKQKGKDWDVIVIHLPCCCCCFSPVFGITVLAVLNVVGGICFELGLMVSS